MNVAREGQQSGKLEMLVAKVVPRFAIRLRVCGIAPMERKSWSSVMTTTTLGRVSAACAGTARARASASSAATAGARRRIASDPTALLTRCQQGL
jgi:hypothetical protein